jgi:hypothetical protein
MPQLLANAMSVLGRSPIITNLPLSAFNLSLINSNAKVFGLPTSSSFDLSYTATFNVERRVPADGNFLP